MDPSSLGSMDPSQALEQLITLKATIMEARYAIVAMFGLQLYEWIAGLEQEIRLVHRARWTFIKILYILCRYYPLWLWIILMWAYVDDHPQEHCDRLVHPIHSLLAPCQFFSQAVMLMRAFAFAGRSSRLLVLLGICYLGLIGIDIWVFCIHVDLLPAEVFWILNRTGCFPNYGDNFMARRLAYSMTAATLMDLISLAVVVIHCLKTRSRDISLAYYFVSQGLSSFAFVSVLNIATLVAFFTSRYRIGFGLPIVMSISNIVACRLILQLRQKVNPTPSQLERQHSSIVRNALMSTGPDVDSWIIEDHS